MYISLDLYTAVQSLEVSNTIETFLSCFADLNWLFQKTKNSFLTLEAVLSKRNLQLDQPLSTSCTMFQIFSFTQREVLA